MQSFESILRKKNRLLLSDGFLCYKLASLFLFVTIATSTAFRIATTSVADVDFFKLTIIARTVVLAIGYATANAGVHFTSFVHHK